MVSLFLLFVFSVYSVVQFLHPRIWTNLQKFRSPLADTRFNNNCLDDLRPASLKWTHGDTHHDRYPRAAI